MTPSLFSCINYKGGTGKTCTVVNMAHAMALKGHRVLIIDTDSQGSVGFHFGFPTKKTLYNLLVENAPLSDCVITVRSNIDIIASNEHMFPMDLWLHKQPHRETIFRDRLHSHISSYDVVLFDCSPCFNLMNQNVLLCAPNVLVPVSMEPLTIPSVRQLIKNIQLLNHHFQANVTVAKIIPTFYNSRMKKAKRIHQDLMSKYPDLVSSTIRNNVSISEAAGEGKTVYEYSPNGPSVRDFNKLSEEVLNYES